MSPPRKALNAFIVETPEKALEAADAVDADARGGQAARPLAGVPIGMKDLFATEGVQTTAGSHILEGFKPDYESTVSQKLWDAGAGMLGKLNLDQFAMGSSNETSYFGNVISPVAAQRRRQCRAGAGRLVGRLGDGGRGAAVPGGDRHRHRRLDPPARRVHRHLRASSRPMAAARAGASSPSPRSLDQAGPMARDVARLRDHARGDGRVRSQGFDHPRPAGARVGGRSVEPISRARRSAFPRNIGWTGCRRRDRRAAGTQGIAWLKDAGAEIVEVILPHTKYALPAYYIIAPAEASSNLARYDGVRYGLRELPEGANLQDMYAATRAAGFGAEVKRRIMIGTYVLSAGFYDAYYTQAQKVRTLIARDFEQAWEQVRRASSPRPRRPPPSRSATRSTIRWRCISTTCSRSPPASPACRRCRVPAGLNGDGLPLGLQMIGKAVRRAGRAQRRAGDRGARGVHGAGRRNGGKMSDYRIQGATGEWEVVIGLEVHAQVTSNAKLFSGASTEFGAEPNTQVSLVDAAMPGMLPVLNRECIRQAVRTGHGDWRRRSTSGRVSTGRIISTPTCRRATRSASSTIPIVGEGAIEVTSTSRNWSATKTIGIERIHVEQDAGKLMHDQHPTLSYVDLNRSGVALMEIVSRPDMRSPEEAGAYCQEAALDPALCRHRATATWRKARMRADVNVSVRKPGDELGTRCEIKNVNSVRFVMAAIEYEASRQVDMIEGGGRIAQETRLFDPDKGETRSMRSKEDAHDYRYFPDPDLLPLELDRRVPRRCRDIACPSCPTPSASATSRDSASPTTMPPS